LKIDASVTKFVLCSDIDYTKNRDGTFAIYQDLTKAGNGKYKILKYSGDSDGVVPTQGTMKWIDQLGLKATKPFRSWDLAGNTAGWITEYENNFTFATIHGAGHMAP
jgi:carboxypeptidase C (cathepsin A)